MIEILAQETAQMQNVYTPLPFTAHLIFCVIATVVYIIQYFRKKSAHYLLIMLAVDATFVTQIYTSNIIIACLFALEVFLLAAAAVFSFRHNRAQKVPTAEKKAKVKADSDDDDWSE